MAEVEEQVLNQHPQAGKNERPTPLIVRNIITSILFFFLELIYY